MFRTLLIFVFSIIARNAMAQNYPSKPIRFIVPWASGGSSDISARILTDELSKELGQPIIVENKPGVGGILGMKTIAESKPDGYTLGIGANSLVAAPVIYKSNLYNWKTDIQTISTINHAPNVILVKYDSEIKNLSDLVTLGKTKPDTITVADSGLGSNLHMVIELISDLTNSKFTSVHYKGTTQATNDLLSGYVDVQIDNLGSALPGIKTGKLRALAVTSDTRSILLPEVPTVNELNINGLSNFSLMTINSVVAPKGLSDQIIKQLNMVINKVLSNKNIIEKYNATGFTAQASTPELSWNTLEEYNKNIVPIIKKLNLSVDQ